MKFNLSEMEIKDLSKMEILATDIERGTLLKDPHNTGGYMRNGVRYYRYYRAMKITKHRIMLDDYSSIPKIDDKGEVIQYLMAE